MFRFLFDLMFSNAINFVINFGNLLLFGFGLYMLYRAFTFLLLNKRELALFKDDFSHPPQPSKNKVMKIIKDTKYSENGSLSEAVHALKELSQTSMDDRDKIMYFEAARNEIRTAIPKAIPTLSVIIGFLGTVLGLFLAVNTMPHIFETMDFSSDQSFQIILDTMVQALNGMGIAFGTTLVGLTISVILTISNLGYRIFWDQYDHEFHNFVALKLFPVFIRPEDETVVMTLLEAIKASQKSMETIELSNGRLLKSVDRLTDNMASYNEENEKIMDGVARVMREFLDSQKGNKTVFQAIKKMADEASVSYRRVENLLDTSLQDREAYIAYLQDSRNEIKEISTIQHKAYEKTNQDFLRSQKNVFDEMNSYFSEQQRQFLDKQKAENEQHMHHFVKKHEEFINHFANVEGELVRKLEQENRTHLDSFLAQSEKAQNEVKVFLKDITTKTTSEMSNTISDIKTVVTGIQDSLETFKTSVLANNKEYESSTIQLINQLSALIQKTIENDRVYFSEEWK